MSAMTPKDTDAVFDSIDAHLTDHAQMVEKVREVIAELRKNREPLEREIDGWSDKLADAIGDAK